MSRCEAELCPNWTGHGCACEVFGLDPLRVCQQCLQPNSPDDDECQLCGADL